MLSSTEYLENTLLPLIESIQPKTTDSFILEACGLDARPSTQSVSITIGARLEKFWNQVLSDMDNTTNMIEESDRVDVNGRTRQIDHFFTIPDLMYASHMYLESKCNLNFDSEGRVSIPEKLLKHAKIKSNIVFVGLGKVFQIWDPKLFESFKLTAEGKASYAQSLPFLLKGVKGTIELQPQSQAMVANIQASPMVAMKELGGLSKVLPNVPKYISTLTNTANTFDDLFSFE